MTMIDSAIDDVAGRFGLGPKAGQLMHEIVHLITGSPGGVGGFLDKFRSAGLGSEVTSWLGRGDGAALTGPQVERALGNTALGGIASRLGLGSGVVATAVGYILPKLIGQITPGGVIPSGIPASLSGFLQATPVQTTTRRVEQVAPRAISVIHDAPHLGRWLIPLLAALGILGLFWYLLSPRPEPIVATAPAPAVLPPAPIPSVPAHLALTNDDGIITYSGVVHDESTRTSIMDALKGTFGADKVKGDITINANAGSAPWLVDLRTALENLKTSGVQAVFDGNSLKVGAAACRGSVQAAPVRDRRRDRRLHRQHRRSGGECDTITATRGCRPRGAGCGWRRSQHAGGQGLWQRQPGRHQRHVRGQIPQSSHRVPGRKAGITVAARSGDEAWSNSEE